MKEQEQRAIKH